LALRAVRKQQHQSAHLELPAVAVVKQDQLDLVPAEGHHAAAQSSSAAAIILPETMRDKTTPWIAESSR
jgi:hypothetical protein